MAQGILGDFLVDQPQGVGRQQSLARKDLLTVDDPHGEFAFPSSGLAGAFVVSHYGVHGFGGVIENLATASGDGFTDGHVKLGDNLFHEKVVDLFCGKGFGFRLVALIKQAALVELLGTHRIVGIDVGLAINNGRYRQHEQIVFAGKFIG